MTKHEAFLAQAKSDFAVFELLLEQPQSDVPQCHPLHYLQMATEKLAKAFHFRGALPLPPRRHDSFHRLASELAKRSDVLKAIGYSKPGAIEKFLKERALGVFKQVEEANPKIADDRALAKGRDRDTSPNSEYPWFRIINVASEDWLAPATHTFSAYQTITDRTGDGALMMRLIKQLIDKFDAIP
ncbi:MAG: hypothetical protein WCP21_16435 [Armatimonadota bacterium]